MIDYLLLIMIPLTLMIICLCAGYLLSRIGSLSLTPSGCIIAGYIGITGAFQLISLPFMQFGLRFTPLFVLSVLLCLAITAAGIVLMIRDRNRLKSSVYNGFRNLRAQKQLILSVIFALIIAFQIAYIVFYQYTDADDSFFVTQINTIIDTNRVLYFDPASGLPELKLNPTYKLVSYEVILSVISRLFHVNAAFLSHTILPVFFIPLHYMIIVLTGKRLFKSHALYFALLYMMTNLFSLYSGYSQGAFFIYRIWQGKGVLIAIIIPALILAFLWISDHHPVLWKTVLILFLILLSGMHASTIGIFLVPIAYFGLAAGYLVFERFDFKKLTGIILPILLFVPLVLLKFFVLSGDQGVGFGSLTEDPDQIDQHVSYIHEFFEVFFNNQIAVFIVFAAALIFLLICSGKRFGNNRKVQWLVAFPSAVIWLTFANPLFMPFIMEHVTSKYVYWRLFWLLQVPLVIVSAVQLAAESFKNKYRFAACLMAGVLMIGLTGVPVYPGKFKHRSNCYKIDGFAVLASDAVNEDAGSSDVTLLVPVELSYEIRQYSSNIKLPINRYSAVNFASSGLSDVYKDLTGSLAKPLYVDHHWDADSIESAAKKHGIDYVILITDTIDTNSIPDSWKKVDEIAITTVYRCY